MGKPARVHDACMEGLILTAGLTVLMAVAVVIMGRGWPRSSRLGGYRARNRDRGAAPAVRDQERGAATREDDDAKWRWDDGQEDGPRD
jgi:hypothetical protein